MPHSPESMTATSAVAEAWATMDGKLEAYKAGANVNTLAEEPGGHFSGYQADAEELIRRIAERGFILVRTKPI